MKTDNAKLPNVSAMTISRIGMPVYTDTIVIN